MDGLMMDYPLIIPKILERANKVFPDKELVSQIGPIKHRHTYAEMYGRVVRLMNVLRKLGVKRGDRVATFGWNHFRHMELYYAIPALGAVLHTLNLRLFPEQLRYIVNHAEDSVIFLDDSLLKPIEGLAPQLKTVRADEMSANSTIWTSSLSARTRTEWSLESMITPARRRGPS